MIFFFLRFLIGLHALCIKCRERQISRVSCHIFERPASQNIRFVGFLWYDCPYIAYQSSRRISIREFLKRTGRGFLFANLARFGYVHFLIFYEHFLFRGVMIRSWSHYYITCICWIILEAWRILTRTEIRSKNQIKIFTSWINNICFPYGV